MALRITGSVIGEPITSSSTSATGMWTSQEVAALQKDGIWQIAPTFTLTPSAATVNEGSSITITLTTTGIPNGAVVPYVITGANVNANDGNITGNFVIQNNSNTISFAANADLTLEGAETLTITAGGVSANVTINDTSTGGDTQFPYTTLLLHGDGTNNAQNNTFLDSSTNNFTITRNGNTNQGTFSPYGSNWSNYFDGSGDYLEFPSNSANFLHICSAPWTFEYWFYTGSTSAQNIFSTDADSVSVGINIALSNGASQNIDVQIYRGSSGNFYRFYTGTAWSLNAWNHVAIAYNGSTFAIYVNGVSQSLTTSGTATFSASNATYQPAIGVYKSGSGLGNYFTGYISNLRAVNGSAVYTGNFIPPTTPLTAIANTSLLTCKSNRFIDNSTNAFAITRAGDVNVQRFSPFSPSSSYSAATYGGSAYFDGSGDYLATASNVALQARTGAFTIEGWVYITGSTSGSILSQVPDVAGGHGVGLVYGAGTNLLYGVITTTSTSAWSASITPAKNAWNHVVLVRDASNNIAFFANGVKIAPTTGGSTNTTDINAFNSFHSGSYFPDNPTRSTFQLTGYVSNARFIKGSAAYDPTQSTITVPTAPVTAISGTSLLCNFTNAGIYDNAMMSNLETVADSKVSTTQSKFGGSAMYFDGTGDYLSIPYNPAFAFGTGDFTIEFWIYLETFANAKNILSQGWPAGYVPYLIYTDTALNRISLYMSSGGGSWDIASEVSIVNTPSINTWYHIAVTRSGSTVRTFANGTQTSTFTTSASLYNNTSPPLTVGGASTGSNNIQGYIDDLRITKGYARYTSNFTPPALAFNDR